MTVHIEVDPVPLNERVQVNIQPAKKEQALYTFIENGKTVNESLGNIPLRLSPQSNIAKRIKKGLDPNKEYKSDVVANKFNQIVLILQENYEVLLNLKDKVEAETRLQQELEDKKKQSEASVKLQSLKYPLNWIASITDWKTAGERNNIIISFLGYSSQVILKNPLSVIGLGDASSGKSHILEVARSYIPKEYILYEKKITEAALFRRSEQAEDFYDGKIVNYGDMGGKNDQDFAEESKALMKELQTDGFLNKPLLVPDGEGGYESKDLILSGRPALTYTTVPGHDFDGQEQSRSIFVTPRMDNQYEFNLMNEYIEFKGITYDKMVHYHKEAELIPYMVSDLREKLEDIEIINPYFYTVVDYLKNSRYYKRDLPKYNNLLKTITALGYYNHEVYECKGKKVIFVTLDDIQLFKSVLEMYHDSISHNLSLKASEILKSLKQNIQKWAGGENYDLEPSITVNTFIEKSMINLDKRSVQRYFGELNEGGFLKVVGKVGNANLWALTTQEKEDENENEEVATRSQELACREIGPCVEEFFEKDTLTEGLTISRQSDIVERPPWSKRENENLS